MATILELFDPDQLDLILEALESRARYYELRIPQQQIDADQGSMRQQATLERYEANLLAYRKILSIVTSEMF